MRIVVTGLLGQYAFGGVTWDYIQYLLGFRALGHDVWYLEDSGAWPYDPVKQTISDDCTFNVDLSRRHDGPSSVSATAGFIATARTANFTARARPRRAT